jgi:hypothetical protein
MNVSSYNGSDCHPGLWGRIQSKRCLEQTMFVTIPCEGRGPVVKLSNFPFVFFPNIFVVEVALILLVVNGFRLSPEVVARYALSGSCPKGQDDKFLLKRESRVVTSRKKIWIS